MDFFVNHDNYDDFLLSFWSQNSPNVTPYLHLLLLSLLASPRSVLGSFPSTLPVPSLLSPPFLIPFRWHPFGYLFWEL